MQRNLIEMSFKNLVFTTMTAGVMIATTMLLYHLIFEKNATNYSDKLKFWSVGTIGALSGALLSKVFEQNNNNDIEMQELNIGSPQ